MSGWIEWAGGLRPHPPQTRVRVKYRDGTEDEGESAFAYWSHEPNGRDIIAYRLVTEPEAQPPGDGFQLSSEERERLLGWLSGLANHPDLTDVVADGGVTAGLVYQGDALDWIHRLSRVEGRL